MDITIHARNIDLNPRAGDYILRKFNMDTGEYNVAYRRRDNDYGLIEPERV